MTELLEKIDKVYAVLNELEALSASDIQDQELALDGYGRNAAALFQNSTKNVEESVGKFCYNTERRNVRNSLLGFQSLSGNCI